MAKKKSPPKDDDTGTGEDQGFLGQARHDIAGAYDTVSGGVQSGINAIAGLDKGWDIFGLGGGDSKPSGPAPQSADQKEIAKLNKELAAAKSQEGSAAPSDAYTKLADEQAKQYLGAVQAAEPLTSGSALPAIESTATQQASQMLGPNASPATTQWLNAQTQAAQAQNAPVAAAMGQTKVAEDYASTLLGQGMQNMGQAEDKMLKAAPYQQLLNTLAADIPYKLLSGGTTFQQLQGEVATAVADIPGLSTTAIPQSAATSGPTLGAGSSGILAPAPPTGYNAPGVGP